MRNKTLLLCVSVVIFSLFLLFLYSMLPGAFSVSIPAAWADDCCGIDTSNEEEPPGDWDAVYLYNCASSLNYVSRTATYAIEGTYSYEHRACATNSSSWAWTYITCTEEAEYGYADAWIRFEADFGHALTYPVLSLGDDDDTDIGGFNWGYAWYVYYDDFEKRLRLACNNCNPNEDWQLDVMIPETWYHIRVEWGLPISDTDGYMHAWLGTAGVDDIKFVEETGLTTDPVGSRHDQVAFGIGVGSWHYFHCDEKAVWTDDIEMSFCAPEPTPTPSPGDCKQYGHAAVLNVSDDECQAVLRFRTLPSYIPSGATVTRATLRIYGVTSEVLGETIYVTPLTALWGEMTCDWCRRLVGTNWVETGAYNVPLDREPGTIANFETALGWIDIELPVGLVEEWALTGEANPGLILHNASLTGKFSIASREWHVEDYQPRINVWYTE